MSHLVQLAKVAMSHRALATAATTTFIKPQIMTTLIHVSRFPVSSSAAATQKLTRESETEIRAAALKQPVIGLNKTINRNMSVRYNVEPVEDAARAASYFYTEEMEATKRPLVIVMPWLLAQENQIERYRQLYLKRGFDVLTVKTGPTDVLMPKTGAHLNAQNLIDFVLKRGSSYDRILVHAFSAGVYQYGEVIVKLMQNQQLLKEFSQRIKGIILDSAPDVRGVAPGFAKSYFPRKPLVGKMVRTLLDGYFKVRHDEVTQHLWRAQESFYQNPLKSPTLFLYSCRDPISTQDMADTYVSRFRESGAPVYLKTWSDTEHVKHFAKYPQEYERVLLNFLQNIRFM